MLLHLLPNEFGIHRLPPDAEVPDWVRGEVVSITRTREELSIVSEPGPEGRRGYRCLKVQGPLDFALVGVLASLTSALAAAAVPVFAISTFDTDYLLIEGAHVDRAISALERNGHVVRR